MSLRFFHIIFVIATSLLLLFLCYWNYKNWIFLGSTNSLVYAFMSLLFTIIILFYGLKFYHKTKELNV